jgi:branched-chain amino acid transport system substrate-binding protein
MLEIKRRARSALLPLVLLGACAAASLPAAAEDCTVKIGVVGPMSGGASLWGLTIKAAADFEAARTNQAGGLQVGDRKCQVKILPFDSLYTAAGGAAAANYLASENVHVTLGPMGAPEVVGFRPVAKRNDIVFFSHTYLADALSPDYPLAFHALQAPQSWGPLLIAAAKKNFDFKSMIIVGANDQGGTDGSKALAKMYAAQGVATQEEYYQRGTTNFAPIAARIMNANPDMVEMATMPPADASVLTRQLMEAGFNGIIGSLGGTGPTPIIQGAGGEAKLKGFYWLELIPVDDPGYLRMRQDYEAWAKAPAPDSSQFGIASNSAETVLRAIALAGTDQSGEKIAAALRSLTPTSDYFGKGGWRGRTQYGVNQELAFPIGLGTIKDGKRLPVLRVEMPAEQ